MDSERWGDFLSDVNDDDDDDDDDDDNHDDDEDDDDDDNVKEKLLSNTDRFLENLYFTKKKCYNIMFLFCFEQHFFCFNLSKDISYTI